MENLKGERVMYKKVYFYLVILLVISIGFAIPGCGGGGNNGTLPVTNTNSNIDSNPSDVTSTPTPVLIQKPIQGYIYYIRGIDTSQTGEEEKGRFIILDIPVTERKDSLLGQLSELQQDNPEVYQELSDELSDYIPLSQYSSDAKLFSVYQDMKSDSPLTVNSDGYFEGSVAISSVDDLVSFEVIIGEKEVYQAKTMVASDILTGSQITEELKSCPNMIITEPGRCEIFEVFADPVVNLKDAGLDFSINDSSVGTVCGPYYLRVRGRMNYNVGYGIFNSKRNITTPVNTIIKAQTNSGLNLDIFTEVVRSTASVSGHVGGQGVIPVFGYVYSCGPWAFDFLDRNGDYKLSRTYKGHFRTVYAVWWTVSNGQWVKHMEERVIDFLQTDVVDFHIPEWVQPTPTATPFPPLLSIYYRKMSSQILQKKIDWMQELGPEPGTKKTVDWLNNKLPEEPLPDSIAEAIEKAAFCPPDSMEYTYKNGLKYVIFGESYLSEEEDLSSLNDKKVLLNSSQSSVPTIVKNKEVLLLGPVCEDWDYNDKIFTNLREDFQSKGFIVKYLHAGGGQLTHKYVRYDEDEKMMYEYSCTMEPNAKYLVRPDDFKNLDQYGVIYINAHGDIRPDENTSSHTMYIQACPLYETADGLIDPELWAFALNKDNIQCFAVGVIPFYPTKYTIFPCYYNSVLLTEKFYDQYIKPKDFSGSIVYLNGCNMWNMHEDFDVFSNAKVFVGTKGGIVLKEMQLYSYYFFSMMLADTPMSARDAYNQTINDYKYHNIGSTLFINTGPSYENDSTYLPGELTVIVDKK
jgi:hypothetical protein